MELSPSQRLRVTKLCKSPTVTERSPKQAAPDQSSCRNFTSSLKPAALIIQRGSFSLEWLIWHSRRRSPVERGEGEGRSSRPRVCKLSKGLSLVKGGLVSKQPYCWEQSRPCQIRHATDTVRGMGRRHGSKSSCFRISKRQAANPL